MWTFWLALMLLALLFEVVTVNLVSIWFAVGAIVSLFASLAGLSLLLQIILFFGVSGLGLLIFILVFKPQMRDAQARSIPTNADRVIGQEGQVLQAIVPYEKPGLIQVCGQTWSATSEDPAASIVAGTKVIVVRLSGVKAVVRPL